LPASGRAPNLPGVRDRLLPLVALLAVLFACDASEDRSASATAGATPHSVAASGDAQAAETAEKKQRERPLPAFSGTTLDGKRIAIGDLIGKRLLLFFFNPEVADAPVAVKAVKSIAELRGQENFEVLGIATGSSFVTASAFAKEHDIPFPVIDDSRASITRRLGLRSPLALIATDAEGYVDFGIGQLPVEGPHAGTALEGMLRDAMRLPPLVSGADPLLGTRPEAPTFRTAILDSEESFDLAAHRGRPVVLIFFLHTCPHCHETLASLKEIIPSLPEDKRPVLVGVEVTGRTSAVRSEMKKLGLDFFPVVFDDDSSIRDAYGVFAGVPDTFVIDANGRIAARVAGWRADRDPPLMRMRLAQLAGAPVPMLLRAEGYTGSEVCGVCHRSEHETWSLTTHATAFPTLVKHGADSDPECVSCHVVGYGKPGGFVSAQETGDLENVGCESCHGRGGPHLSPDFVTEDDYAPLCEGCHDKKHSLGFDYATFLPIVSHAANAHLAALSLEEKQALLAERGQIRDGLLPTSAKYVGSDACRSCHSAEFETWSKSPHSHAVETLAKNGSENNAECLRCHTTGFGRSGGFAEGSSAADQPDLGRVGCESCHGPGGDHVSDGSVKIGTIVSLGDKCDSCVILQICGSCHDQANDPGFEFAVQEKIDRQRHGTIEPGTGKPKAASAALPSEGGPHALLWHAFDRLGDRG
jgi:peroxiredoxin/nitrate/TMAO reductase-like tetraheme cytochrome c subunit